MFLALNSFSYRVCQNMMPMVTSRDDGIEKLKHIYFSGLEKMTVKSCKFGKIFLGTNVSNNYMKTAVKLDL